MPQNDAHHHDTGRNAATRPAGTPPFALADAPLPLYQRIKQPIIQNIRSGAWTEGFRVPSENELMRDLGVSRMTAHRALRELTAEGFLVRVHGVGTFVAGTKPQGPMMEIRSIADEITARGHRHEAAIITQEIRPADAELAEVFGVPVGAELFHTVLVHRENQTPVQIEDRFVNPAAVPGYFEQDFTRITPHIYLMGHSPPSQGEHVVEAVLPEDWERKLLFIDRREPCLLIRRRTWSGDIVVSAARLLYPGSRYRLGGRFETRSE